VFFATSKGVVKKTSLMDFSRPRTNGIIAIDLRIDDFLIDVALTDGKSDVMLISSGGRAMRFSEVSKHPTVMARLSVQCKCARMIRS